VYLVGGARVSCEVVSARLRWGSIEPEVGLNQTMCFYYCNPRRHETPDSDFRFDFRITNLDAVNQSSRMENATVSVRLSHCHTKMSQFVTLKPTPQDFRYLLTPDSRLESGLERPSFLRGSAVQVLPE
jgi:hypothetical protein